MTRATAKVRFPVLTPAQELIEMLTFRRPAWSRTEHNFIFRFLQPLGVEEDEFGNLYKRIGDAPVLWSSHTDTVHMKGGRQLLSFAKGMVWQADPKSNCLGADCTAGVWLMMQMIRAGKPGLYVFHRAEEIGGHGSSFIARHRPNLLAGIKFAIAFDRHGHNSIITHQGDRCCSEAFAASLADELGMGHGPDSGGTFTDTANYVDAIGECTNISVGYMSEHTKRESLDADYLQELLAALLRLDTSKLVAARAPGEPDPDDYCFHFQDDDQEPSRGENLHALLRDYPAEVADWLEEYGITADEVATAIHLRGGVLRKRRY